MKPQLCAVSKIWDKALHNALTDLAYYQEKFFCCFRESDQHVFGQNGQIRILFSRNGILWKAHTLIVKEGVDLRDPKLSITPQGQLQLLVEEVVYKEKRCVSRHTGTAFLLNGKNWSPLRAICRPSDWLWRVTWHQNKAWGVSYQPKPNRWRVWLFTSGNGLDWEEVVEWNIPGKPNETTLRFMPDGTMVALVRRNIVSNGFAWIGRSRPPYKEWRWSETRHHIGGPNFLILPNGQMWGAGRLVERNPYGWFEKVALFQMTLDKIQPALLLPSGGIDCSYPGMVILDNCLWMSYYSSHEGRAAIYLAQVKIV